MDPLRVAAERVEVVADQPHGQRGPLPAQHVLDAVTDRLAEGHVRTRHDGERRSQVGQERLAAARVVAQDDLDLARFRSLHVLVALGAAGAPRRRHHRRIFEQRLFGQVGQRVALVEARPRREHDGHVEAPFPQLGQKSLAGEEERRHAECGQRDRAGGEGERLAHRRVEDGREGALEPADQRRLARRERAPRREQERRQHRRDVTATRSEAPMATR